MLRNSLSLSFLGVGVRSVVELWCAFSVPLSRSSVEQEREREMKRERTEKTPSTVVLFLTLLNRLLSFITCSLFSLILYVCAAQSSQV